MVPWPWNPMPGKMQNSRSSQSMKVGPEPVTVCTKVLTLASPIAAGPVVENATSRTSRPPVTRLG